MCATISTKEDVYRDVQLYKTEYGRGSYRRSCNRGSPERQAAAVSTGEIPHCN